MDAETFSRQALYAPLRPWLERGVATLEDLNAEARRLGLCSGGGQPLQFVPPGQTGAVGYEAQAYRQGQVETRPDNWHDLFGAYVWLSFPRAKAAMNRRHWQALQQESTSRRGPARDALTQFDECGVVVLSTDITLWQGIRAHRWRETFADRRAAVAAHLRFLVFGHGSYDALRAPFVGLCGKAVCFEVASLPDDVSAQTTLADELLADLFETTEDLSPRHWQPLPLLGIPGATAENEEAGYYDDLRQFRPARTSGNPDSG